MRLNKSRSAVLFCIRSVSILFRSMGIRCCRFYPSCSVYACEAFERFGILKAAGLTTKRIFRCHPFSGGGWDPLPSGELMKKGTV